MTEIPTFTGEQAESLIRNKKPMPAEYHVSGWLDLRGCNLAGVTLPASIRGGLYLRGCDLAGVTLPASIGGSLYLRGCNLAGITLPTSISGGLYLSGCKNFIGPSHWIARSGNPDRFRVLACHGEYHLEQTESDLFTAGCRKLFTRAEALAYLSRTDARAVLFTSAIKAATL